MGLYDGNPLGLASAFGYTPNLKPPSGASSGVESGGRMGPTGASPTSMLTPGGYPTIGDTYKDFSSIFKPPASIDPSKVASDIQAFINQKAAPLIKAPTVTPAQITLPGGTIDQYRTDLYNKEFLPVSQEVARQRSQADTALSGQLAQAGLADSGSGVGQREQQAEHYDTYLQQQAANMSAAAGATAAQAEIGVLSSNAQLTQQARLANAGFDLTAQTENAKNILTGNTAAAQGYLAALGISGQQAAAYRDSFLRYLGGEEQVAAQKDTFRLNAQGTYLNFLMQQRKLDQDQYATELQNNTNAVRNALDYRQIENNFQTAMAQIDSQRYQSMQKSAGGGGGAGGRQPYLPNPNQPTPDQIGGTNRGTNTAADMGVQGANAAALGYLPQGPSQSYGPNNFGPVFGGSQSDGAGFFAPSPDVSAAVSGGDMAGFGGL